MPGTAVQSVRELLAEEWYVPDRVRNADTGTSKSDRDKEEADGFDEDAEAGAAARKRKREEFDQMMKDLTTKKITFT